MRNFRIYELALRSLCRVCFLQQCVLLFSPQEVIKVDAVLGLVTPIGAQMEFDRERVSLH